MVRLPTIQEHAPSSDYPLVALKMAVVTLGLAVLLGLWHDEVVALSPGGLTRSRAVAFYCAGGPEPSLSLLSSLSEAGFESEALAYSDAEAERLEREIAGPGARGQAAGYVRQAADEGGCATARFADLLRGLEAASVPELGRQQEERTAAAERWEAAAGLAANATGAPLGRPAAERPLGDDVGLVDVMDAGRLHAVGVMTAK